MSTPTASDERIKPKFELKSRPSAPRKFVSYFLAGMKPLRDSPFSYNFNMLIFLGSWFYEPRHSWFVPYYTLYRLGVTVSETCGIISLLVDLYSVFGNLKKMSWNICVTLLGVGTMTKNLQILSKYEVINGLRLGLHEDAESRTEAEDLEIHEEAVKEIKFLQSMFYWTAILFIPAWLVTRYAGSFKGVRLLPLPMYIPGFIDMENDVVFNLTFITIAVCTMFFMRKSMEGELSMFGLLIQISREYKVLLKDIPKISKLYEDELEDAVPEFNLSLRKTRAKKLVKEFSIRQRKLLEYIKAFEFCFSQPLLFEFLTVSITILALALQCLWESVDLFGYILYEFGYLSITVTNLFLICFYCTRIQIQSARVGEEVYATLWYKMDTDLQKDIQMILMKSQDPPKLTMGKFVNLSLPAFSATMSHLYSWLTLIREFDVSST